MDVENLPNWLRWLAFLPAAVLGMIAIHFVVALTFSGSNAETARLFGLEFQGSAAQGINSFKYLFLGHLIEPCAFVAAGGMVAPRRLGPAIGLAVFMGFFCALPPLIYLAAGNQPPLGVLFNTGLGISGAIAGVYFVSEYKEWNFFPEKEEEVEKEEKIAA